MSSGPTNKGKRLGMNRPDGSHTLCSDQMIKQIEEALLRGLYILDACNLFGVGKTTWYHWLKMGRQFPDKYPQCVKFLAMVQRSNSQVQDEFVKPIKTAAGTDWKAAAWFLEHRFARQWGKKDRLEVSFDEAEIEDLDKKTEDELLAELESLDAAIEEIEGNAKRKK